MKEVQAAFKKHDLIANIRLETYQDESFFHVPPPSFKVRCIRTCSLVDWPDGRAAVVPRHDGGTGKRLFVYSALSPSVTHTYTMISTPQGGPEQKAPPTEKQGWIRLQP